LQNGSPKEVNKKIGFLSGGKLPSLVEGKTNWKLCINRILREESRAEDELPLGQSKNHILECYHFTLVK
jgi:hypothetical protein